MKPATPPRLPDPPQVAGRPNGKPERRAMFAVLPTLFTLANLVAGFAAIYYASKPPPDIYETGIWNWTALTIAGGLVFIGLVVDGVDGAVARLTGAESEAGAQLDSLADLVTFGVAPAFMALRLVIIHVQGDESAYLFGPEADSAYGRIIWAFAAVFVCCAALRLARFNVESSVIQVSGKKRFRGLPSPGAAGTVVALIILHQHLLVAKFGGEVSKELVEWTALVVPAVMVLCALAMVSSIPYVHFTNTFIMGSRSFPAMVRLALTLVLAIWWLHEVLAVCFLAYAASGPVMLIYRKVKRRE